MKFNCGDNIQIHCYKHNGKIHRIWEETMVLEETSEYLICANNKTTVIENDGRIHKTKEPAIIYFYKNNWFNIIAQFKEYGLFYYCNIASPYLIVENTIKYIDFDLDVRVFAVWGYRILDKNEYKYHKKIMNYSSELDLVINKELEQLIKMINNRLGPFCKKELLNYFEQYKKIKNI